MSDYVSILENGEREKSCELQLMAIEKAIREGKSLVFDGIRYVPERTCHMTLVKRGPICSVWEFDCCGFEYVENECSPHQTELPGTWCPNCGAKVVDE